ncbi:ATP-binding protein [Haloferula sp. A504]|uniref:ATP-binding protein n=1 Tax=Haloferula sp. A504 TaxID=3373601 RepID=UPI0031BF3FE1|nr:ATP-binding protein [Verrucomicrobiaceae bacterium E54]
MISRPSYADLMREALRRTPVCALLGPRQCGKTTLARAIAGETESHYFDLESPRDRLRLQNPELALGALSGLVVLDEVQAMPELFPVLRVLADRPAAPARFLILGSASPQLIRQSSETLAGRVEFVDLHGFDIRETGIGAVASLWVRGGFPRSFLAASDEDSSAWREGFVRTFLERDLPQFGIRVGAQAMRRFWTMLAHSHGQLWNASELGRALGLSDKTVKSYLDDLTQTYMVRQLQPWFENLRKRQVKSPKIYLRDSGLLHHLLSLGNEAEISAHPKVGASWEGFALEQVLRIARPRDAYFWATQGGAELDLLVFEGGRRIGYEFKYSENPSITKSMRIAIRDLDLSELRIVCPGELRARLDDRIEVIGLAALPLAQGDGQKD